MLCNDLDNGRHRNPLQLRVESWRPPCLEYGTLIFGSCTPYSQANYHLTA